jgi:hypothetical protein
MQITVVARILYCYILGEFFKSHVVSLQSFPLTVCVERKKVPFTQQN